MNVELHRSLTGKIMEIANRLRGPYRPPQYRLVMLPMVVVCTENLIRICSAEGIA
jgi:type I restriction enzyme M protein